MASILRRLRRNVATREAAIARIDYNGGRLDGAAYFVRTDALTPRPRPLRRSRMLLLLPSLTGHYGRT